MRSIAQSKYGDGPGSASNSLDLLTSQSLINMDEEIALSLEQVEPDFDLEYGLLEPQQTVLVRAYADDADDQMLAEIKPRYIVMYEPNQDFVRRIEVGFLKMWEKLSLLL